MLKIEGSVAVITGGGSGIGECVAKYWVENGGKVVLGDIVPDALERVASEIKESGGEVVIEILDPLGDPDDPANDTYLEMMRNNLAIIMGALA